MIADIEVGKVETILVKDLSRAGRDYLQTGFYTEVLFRQHNIRFIAIGNGIDSADPTSTVNFRFHKASYKDKSSLPNAPEDWLIFENTHEASIDRETWELVQKLPKMPRRIDTFGEANPPDPACTMRTAAQKCAVTVPGVMRRSRQ